MRALGERENVSKGGGMAEVNKIVNGIEKMEIVFLPLS